MNTTQSLHIPDHVLCEQLNDETVLLDMRSGHYFGLSPVASHLWMLLQAGTTLEDAKTTLLREFDVDAETLNKDVEQLLQTLEDKHLLERLNKS